MITCQNCNTQLEDGTKFCMNCGAQIVQPTVSENEVNEEQNAPQAFVCSSCGQQINEGDRFCLNCGAALSVGAPTLNNTQYVETEKPKSKFPKKLVIFGSAGVSLILVIAIILGVLFSGGSRNNFALYLKDKEMYFTKISKLEPWQVTEDLFDNADFDESDIDSYGYAFGLYSHLSQDGKIIFFIDKMDEDADGPTVYYRYVNRPNQEPVKIDSDIITYQVSDDGKTVVYTKGDDDVLYYHNLEDKEKIASDVEQFQISPDGKKVLFANDDGDLYLQTIGKDKEKIESDLSSIEYVSDDLSTIYYIEEDTLYKKQGKKDKEKIASDVDEIICVYESGEIYYTKSETETVKLINYVEDDMKTQDAGMTEPEYPEYPSYFDYDSLEEYQAAVEKYEEDYDNYYDAMDDWYDKRERDELREELNDEKIEIENNSLHFYNGKETIDICESFDTYEDYAVEKPVLFFYSNSQASIDKVKLSDIDSIYDVEEMVEDALSESAKPQIAVGEKVSEIEREDAENFRISDDGKTVFFFDDISEEEDEGDLYMMTISGDKPQKAKLYDSDVYAYSANFMYDDNFKYFKDVKDDKGELYINKEKIDYDVYLYGISYDEDSENIVYFTDWNEDKDYGTLKIFNGKKAVKIADDIHDFSITPGGEVLYLGDYNVNSCKGELFIYNGSKSKKIDDDVMVIIPILNASGRILAYYNY